jgi:hypothetical protein
MLPNDPTTENWEKNRNPGDNHTKNNLAKFGYVLDMEVFLERNQNPSICLAN